jgi:hypothetical protein
MGSGSCRRPLGLAPSFEEDRPWNILQTCTSRWKRRMCAFSIAREQSSTTRRRRRRLRRSLHRWRRHRLVNGSCSGPAAWRLVEAIIPKADGPLPAHFSHPDRGPVGPFLRAIYRFSERRLPISPALSRFVKGCSDAKSTLRCGAGKGACLAPTTPSQVAGYICDLSPVARRLGKLANL